MCRRGRYAGLPRELCPGAGSPKRFWRHPRRPGWIPKIYNGHDRTFFFFSWEQFRQTVGGPVTSTVPTAAERTGDFSQFLQTNKVLGTNPCDGTPVYYGQIFDPSTTRVVNGRPCRTAFPNNQIPTASISPVASNILKYYPAPQNSNIVNNYTINSPYPSTTPPTPSASMRSSAELDLWLLLDPREHEPKGEPHAT